MRGRRILPLQGAPVESWEKWERDAFLSLSKTWSDQERRIGKIAIGYYLAFSHMQNVARKPCPSGLNAFMQYLADHLATSTIHRYLQRLYEFCCALNPGEDWSWMPDLFANMRRDPVPAKQLRRPPPKARITALPPTDWPAPWKEVMARAFLGTHSQDDDLRFMYRAAGDDLPPLAITSQRVLITAVGLYLRNALEADPQGALTPSGLVSFIEATAPHVSEITLWGYVTAIRRFAVRGWGRDQFRWLQDACLELKHRSDSHLTKRQATQIVGASALQELGWQLVNQARQRPLSKNAAVQHRDGVMILFLVHQPVRISDLVAITIGSSVRLRDSGVSVSLVQSKTGQPVGTALPTAVAEALKEHVTIYRPLLAANRIHQQFWTARTGDPLTKESLWWTIAERTKKHFGRSIPPHAFRTNVATTIAANSPDHPELVMFYLGQTSLQSQEPYSAIGRRIGASTQYQAAVRATQAGDLVIGSRGRHQSTKRAERRARRRG